MKRLDRLDITGDQNVLKISIVPPIAPSMFIHEIVWTQKTIDGTPLYWRRRLMNTRLYQIYSEFNYYELWINILRDMYFRLLFTAIVYHIMNIYTAERRVEVKLPKIWTYMKSRDGKNQRREEKRRRRNIKEEKVRRRKIHLRQKVG